MCDSLDLRSRRPCPSIGSMLGDLERSEVLSTSHVEVDVYDFLEGYLTEFSDWAFGIRSLVRERLILVGAKDDQDDHESNAQTC